METQAVVIPNVIDFLTKEEIGLATFIKPVVGREITLVHEDDCDGTLPVASVLAVRRLRLRDGNVIPFHVHLNKEKLYIFEGFGASRVTVIINGTRHDYEMKSGKQLIIPAGSPHCLSYFPLLAVTCNILVVSSSRDGGDILWEDGVEELIKNKRRK